MKYLFLTLLTTLLHTGLYSQQYRSLTVAEFQSEMETMDGRPQIINFWATWCGPCVEELDHFFTLANTYHSHGLKVVFVSLDFRPANLEKYLAEKKFAGEVIYLTDGLRDPDWIEEMDASWSGAIPATLAFQPGSDLRQFHEGSFTYESLLAWLQPDLLALD